MKSFLGDQLSARKLRLFGCACVRGVWEHLPADTLRRAIETCERFADGLARAEELEAARLSAEDTGRGMGNIIVGHSAIAVASLCRTKPRFPIGDGYSSGISSVAAEIGLRRGTPFHVAEAEAKRAHCALLRDVSGSPFRQVGVDLTRQTSAVVSLAKSAYEDRSLPEGTLDPARLTLLADALEDAGCTDAELVAHLRGPGPHVRGCWAVDLVLGLT
jgi:hypothetical protein